MDWCGLWSGEIIIPYFFADEDSITITVILGTHGAMITDFLGPILMWKMFVFYKMIQCATIDLLLQTFDGCLISRNGNVNWPPRRCYLTPLNYLLLAAVKEKHYAKKARTIAHLKAHIRNAISEISYTLAKVQENWSDWSESGRSSNMNEWNSIPFPTKYKFGKISNPFLNLNF